MWLGQPVVVKVLRVIVVPVPLRAKTQRACVSERGARGRGIWAKCGRQGTMYNEKKVS